MNPWAIAGIALICVITFYWGFHTSRSTDSTPDFLYARRVVRSRRNAAAIAGEYLCAASFLGVAGLILKDGVGALWYAIGFTAGFLALLLFVSAPLRRSGAYTVPDFVQARLGSNGLRTLCTVVVVLIGVLYLVPQLQVAGLALSTIMPVPGWVGDVAIIVLVLVNVAAGGMRSITLVQAFQYWIKLFAIMIPALILVAVFVVGHLGQSSLSATEPPTFPVQTTITVHTPVNLMVGGPVWLSGHGVIDGYPTDGPTLWNSGVTHQVGADSTLIFPAGAPVPTPIGVPDTNASWLQPESGGVSGLLGTYSLLLALFLGAMGLPHILVRFYTNPTGSAARRTTLHVLLLLGLFYLFPTLLGALSRLYTPELLVTGHTDAAILLVPGALLSGVPGELLSAVVIAGTCSVLLSTSSGLVMSVAGVLSTDLFPSRIRDFRVAAVLVGAIPLALALLLPVNDVARTVGMAFALAASTFCPVLVLGIWWKRLTWIGAAAGIVVGGVSVLAALLIEVINTHTGAWVPWVVTQPALVTVPLAFLTMIVLSKATMRHISPDVNRLVLRMHAPDRLGLVREWNISRFGTAEERIRLAERKHGD